MKQNICKFNVFRDENENISILNFVHKKNFAESTRYVMNSIFRLHIVIKGKGHIDTLNSRTPLSKGDLFVTFPSTNYRIIDEGELELLYISFIGLNTYNLLERAELSTGHFIQNHHEDLIDFWINSLDLAQKDNIDLIAEGVLLYTLGIMCTIRNENESTGTETCVLRIKKQAEDRFSDPKVCLKTLCEENFYNPKYVSAAFKKLMGIGFNQYLFGLRFNNASRLMENGLTSIKQIAALSGFDDALYFSRVFKKKMGVSPSEYIAGFPDRTK